MTRVFRKSLDGVLVKVFETLSRFDLFAFGLKKSNFVGKTLLFELLSSRTELQVMANHLSRGCTISHLSFSKIFSQ